MVAKRALLIGINYTGTQHALKGCCNDVLAIKDVLQNMYGFDEGEMVVLMDEGDYEKPTGHNIKSYMKRMIDDTQSGDILFIHYSGHGTQVPNKGANDEEDGKDEALVPSDMNLVLDDDLKEMLSRLPEGANCTFVSDCCHSGTMTDGGHHVVSGKKTTTELSDFQVSASSAGGGQGGRDVETQGGGEGGGLFSCLSACLGQVKDDVVGGGGDGAPKREIPAAEIFQLLGGLANGQVNPGNVMNILGSLFGDDATVKVNPNHGASGNIGDDRFVLISGCQDHETSADCPAAGGKPARGALTDALTTVLREYPNQNDGRAPNNRTLVLAVRNILLQQGIAQNPCLEATEQNADSPFLTFNGHGGANAA